MKIKDGFDGRVVEATGDEKEGTVDVCV